MNRARMFHSVFIGRQFIRSGKQISVLVMCVMLSVATIASLGGLSNSIHSSVMKDSRALHSGDIIVTSANEISAPVAGEIKNLAKRGVVDYSKVYDFYSLARNLNQNSSLLADIKVVTPGYPFYGKIVLASGRAFQDVLIKGSVIAEASLLKRMHLNINDKIRIGETVLTITDILLSEPDRPITFFSLGPRIFVSADDLEAIDLVKKGSRIHYKYLLKVHDEREIDSIAKDLKAKAIQEQERVDTFKTAPSGIRRFFDNFIFFLSLSCVFTIILAGFGIQSSLSAFIRENLETIAIMKTIGARGNFIAYQYIVIVLIAGVLGTILGVASSFPVQAVIFKIFKGLLPQSAGIVFSWQSIWEIFFLGIVANGLFAILPLLRIKDIKPQLIFGKESIAVSKTPVFYVVISILLFLFLSLALWRLNDVKTGLLFILGVAAIILFNIFIVRVTLYFLKRPVVRSLVLRQALRGLFRPGNATLSIIVTLSISVSVVFSMFLVEYNLNESFVHSYPAESPNLFFIDIQPDQQDEFKRILGMEAVYYPIVRARMISINGERINSREEMKRKGDNLARNFNLTFRDVLLKNEKIIKGTSLFGNNPDEPQVSVLDHVATLKDMEIGDVISFNIQGVPVTARISSIRTRTENTIEPFFYFVFPEKVLKSAPHTIFTAVHVDNDSIPELQNKIVSRFSNISAIDMSQTIRVYAKVLGKFSAVIHLFAFLGMIAGVLIIISSIFATRLDRIREAVYYKILGGTSGFVIKVFSVENFLLGFISAVIAMLISQTGCWIICTRLFDINYKPVLTSCLWAICGIVMMVMITGMLASLSVMKHKPVQFLRTAAE